MAVACTTNVTSWAIGITSGTIIYSSMFVELQNAINRENTRRGMPQDTFDSVAVGVTFKVNNVAQLKANIDEIRSTYPWGYPALTWSESFVQGESISASKINMLRTNINDIEEDCLCNCAYCTCQCNYCTCNCNYGCTCNCNYTARGYGVAGTCNSHSNYCACACNYCTCQCNYSVLNACNCNYDYSDKRLKKEINFL